MTTSCGVPVKKTWQHWTPGGALRFRARNENWQSEGLHVAYEMRFSACTINTFCSWPQKQKMRAYSANHQPSLLLSASKLVEKKLHSYAKKEPNAKYNTEPKLILKSCKVLWDSGHAVSNHIITNIVCYYIGRPNNKQKLVQVNCPQSIIFVQLSNQSPHTSECSSAGSRLTSNVMFWISLPQPD